MKYKVLIENNIKIGRFLSEDGFIEVVEPNDKEKKVIDAFVNLGSIAEVKAEAPKKSTRKTTSKKSAE